MFNNKEQQNDTQWHKERLGYIEQTACNNEKCYKNFPAYSYFFHATKIVIIIKTEYIKRKKRAFSDSLAVRTGLEPVTPCVTGMYSNQLN